MLGTALFLLNCYTESNIQYDVQWAVMVCRMPVPCPHFTLSLNGIWKKKGYVSIYCCDCFLDEQPLCLISKRDGHLGKKFFLIDLPPNPCGSLKHMTVTGAGISMRVFISLWVLSALCLCSTASEHGWLTNGFGNKYVMTWRWLDLEESWLASSLALNVVQTVYTAAWVLYHFMKKIHHFHHSFYKINLWTGGEFSDPLRKY